MTIRSTRLEELFVPELIRILLLNSAFVRILTKFGEDLLQNYHLTSEIENFQCKKKINHIFRQYCQKFGKQATYERVAEILIQNGFQDLADKVNAEGKSKRAKTALQGTKIEYADIPDLRTLLLTDDDFSGRLNGFSALVRVQTQPQLGAAPKTHLSHILYNFHQSQPEKAVYEFLIDIIGNEMGLHRLAGKVRARYCPGSHPHENLAINLQKPNAKCPIPMPKIRSKVDSTSSSSTTASTEYTRASTSFEKETEPEINLEAPVWSECQNQTDQVREYCERIEIKDGEIGYSYESLFGKYFTPYVSKIVLEDPYLTEPHQVENFGILLDLILDRCPNLNEMSVITSRGINICDFDNFDQKCRNIEVVFNITEKRELHDRCIQVCYLKEIIISLGRGLDIHKGRQSNKNIDQKFKICKESRILAVHAKPNKEQMVVARISGGSPKICSSSSPKSSPSAKTQPKTHLKSNSPRISPIPKTLNNFNDPNPSSSSRLQIISDTITNSGLALNSLFQPNTGAVLIPGPGLKINFESIGTNIEKKGKGRKMVDKFLAFKKKPNP